ncbi:MAG: hypothetical protein J7L59_02925, partial [Nanoarchaeota archaeon]|nr:hypothetical protein [Nanoarchaeota archaeon]
MTILERGAQKISQEIQAAPKVDEEKNLATLLTYQEMTNQGAQRDIVDQSVQALVSKVATSSYIPPQLGIVMKRGTWDSEKFGRYIPAFFGVQPVWEKVKDIGKNIYGPTGSQKDFVSLTAMKELGVDLGPATDA